MCNTDLMYNQGDCFSRQSKLFVIGLGEVLVQVGCDLVTGDNDASTWCEANETVSSVETNKNNA